VSQARYDHRRRSGNPRKSVGAARRPSKPWRGSCWGIAYSAGMGELSASGSAGLGFYQAGGLRSHPRLSVSRSRPPTRAWISPVGAADEAGERKSERCSLDWDTSCTGLVVGWRRSPWCPALICHPGTLSDIACPPGKGHLWTSLRGSKKRRWLRR
jgi:hypothetical protein